MSLKKLAVALVLICPLLVGCGSGSDDSGKKDNGGKTTTSSGVFKTVTKDNLVYRNTSFEKDENGYTVITEVENKSDMPRKVTTIYLEFKDKDGNVVENLTSYVGEEIKPNDSVATIAKTPVDLSSAKSVEYTSQ